MSIRGKSGPGKKMARNLQMGKGQRIRLDGRRVFLVKGPWSAKSVSNHTIRVNAINRMAHVASGMVDVLDPVGGQKAAAARSAARALRVREIVARNTIRNATKQVNLDFVDAAADIQKKVKQEMRINAAVRNAMAIENLKE